VETPVLVHSPGVDRHVDAHAVPPHGYLATSPEYHMKRLLAAGSGPIYQLTRAFRLGERGGLHDPEFTMLEWYRPGWDHEMLMGEVEQLLVDLAGRHAPGTTLSREGYERVTFAGAFQRCAGIDPHTASADRIREACPEDGPDLATADREGWLTWLQASRVEPTLGRGRPTFVHLYPADQCALARIRPDDPPVAERFELYCEGIELANGFGELTDSREQRKRIEDENRARELDSKPTYPVDEAFLEALDSMPASAGVALGVDRVVMLLLGKEELREVRAFTGELER
jgi:elongation factor P--(R)-beta-lysine ligase